ncbi:hypothetical protein [Niveispirillum irakense]|uniref:hypothetical protein n=1 Tax=Niveispirillum irakense TaxID=34011 RepID=UPI000404BC0C|nr:hypothetical protein [Niveispirillum irakense]
MSKNPSRKDDRKDRLAQALRDNLRKRKEQNRARDTADEADAPNDAGQVESPTA